MKYLGRTLGDRWFKEVSLKRPDGSVWNLRMRPLTLGFPQWLHEHGVIPPPVPVKVSRKDGGRIQRDAEGQAQLERDFHHPDYQYELSRYQIRVAVLGLWKSLQDDQTLQFETSAPAPKGDWNKFADQLTEELENAGFTLNDLLFLCEELHRFQDNSHEFLQESRQLFFSGATAETS